MLSLYAAIHPVGPPIVRQPTAFPAAEPCTGVPLSGGIEPCPAPAVSAAFEAQQHVQQPKARDAPSGDRRRPIRSVGGASDGVTDAIVSQEYIARCKHGISYLPYEPGCSETAPRGSLEEQTSLRRARRVEALGHDRDGAVRDGTRRDAADAQGLDEGRPHVVK